MDVTLSRQHNIKYLEYVSGLKRSAIKYIVHGLKEKGYITIFSKKGHGNIYTICQKIFDDYVNIGQSRDDLPVENDDEDLMGWSRRDHLDGHDVTIPQSRRDPLIETKEIETKEIENYSLSPVATPPVDKSDLCHFDVIESVTAPLEESMSNSDPDPFTAFDSVVDLDQSHDVSLTASKSGLESIETPDLTLDCRPEPKAAKKRLKRDQTASKKHTPSEGSQFFDEFNVLRKKRYFVDIARSPKNSTLCKQIVGKIPSVMERHVMMLWFFERTPDKFILSNAHSLEVFSMKLDLIRAGAYQHLHGRFRKDDFEIAHFYEHGKIIEADGNYKIEYQEPITLTQHDQRAY
jgi:hypothetical protein